MHDKSAHSRPSIGSGPGEVPCISDDSLTDHRSEVLESIVCAHACVRACMRACTWAGTSQTVQNSKDPFLCSCRDRRARVSPEPPIRLGSEVREFRRVERSLGFRLNLQSGWEVRFGSSGGLKGSPRMAVHIAHQQYSTARCLFATYSC